MKKVLKKRDGPRCPKPVEQCREAARHAASVRKLLRQLIRGSGKRGSGRNALCLVDLIERLARKAQRANASEAVSLAGSVEVLASMLSDEVDSLLMHPGRQTFGLRFRLDCFLRVFRMKSSIGETIRIIRSAKDMSLRKLAAASNLSVPFLSLVESGQRQPSLSAIQAVAKALNVPSEVLVLVGLGQNTKLKSTNAAMAELTKSIRTLIALEERLRTALREHKATDET
jgi:transcriptional regulator with XRE-family HTH domain